MERVALIALGLVLLGTGTGSYAIAKQPPYQHLVQLLGWPAVGGGAAAIGLCISR